MSGLIWLYFWVNWTQTELPADWPWPLTVHPLHWPSPLPWMFHLNSPTKDHNKVTCKWKTVSNYCIQLYFHWFFYFTIFIERSKNVKIKHWGNTMTTVFKKYQTINHEFRMKGKQTLIKTHKNNHEWIQSCIQCMYKDYKWNQNLKRTTTSYIHY